MAFYVGMDVGATNMRIQLAGEKGNFLSEWDGEGCTVNISGYNRIAEIYRRELTAALSGQGLQPQDCAGLCVGACGVDTPELKEDYIRIFTDMGFPRSVLRVYNDCEMLTHINESRAGIVVVAGTGSIVMGRDLSNQLIRYGGWGHILSDDGSAYDIALQAMGAVLRYRDGLGDCELLARMFEEESGLTNNHDLSQYALKNTVGKTGISKFAPLVTKAAEMGDAGAVEVLKKAARRLYRGVNAVARALNLEENDEFGLLYWGSVLQHSPLVSGELSCLVEADYPNVVITYPGESAVSCALKIAQRPME